MLKTETSSRANNRGIRIKKSTMEWTGILFLLIFSFFNSMTLLISLLLLLVLLTQRQIGALKIINIITLRTIINPGLAVGIENHQNLKWVILFGCSIYLITSFTKMDNKASARLIPIIIIIILFTIYNIIIAFVNSSLPVVAIFKLFSYVVIFIGTLIGVGYTFNKINWLKWMFNLMSLVLISSVVLVFLPVGFLRNGVSFQGITNQPNMFGIIAVLFVSVALAYGQTKKNISNYNLIMIPLSLFLVILSQSRTALLSSLLLILIYFLLLKTNRMKKIIAISFTTTGVIFLILGSSINDFLMKFLYKGQEQGGLLNSRLGQIDGLMANFLNRPWFGNGFSVPVLPFKSYEFNSEYIVEPGNLILAVLSYSGVTGFFLFISYLIRIFWVNKSNFSYVGFLPLATILISMGEMVFFSSNNIAIWCYMFLGIYIFHKTEKY